MDDINQKVSNSSLGSNDLQKAIAEWLQTWSGSFYERSFLQCHSGLVNGQGHLSMTRLKRLLSNLDVLGEPMENMLYQFDSKGKPKRELCDDKTFEGLIKAGDCANFLMNAWVDISDKKLQLLKDRVQRLHKAFHQPFQGKNVDWIEEGFTNYKNIYDVNRHDGRMVPVIQSSGMGKSRTMAEWAKRRLILSICLRDILGEMEGKPRINWPPGDKPVCKFFANPPRPTDPKMKDFEGVELAGAFLGAFYTVVADLLQQTTLSEPEDLQTFSASWTFDDPNDIEESPRHKTFTTVCETAEQLLAKNEVAIRENRGIREITITPNLYMKQGMLAWFDSIFTLLVKEKGKELMDICRKSELSSDFIVVLDECDELDKCDHCSIDALQRIIKAGEEHGIWFFLLGTNPGILDLHPRVEVLSPSSRPFNDPRSLPPWVYFEYDVMVPNRVRPTTPWEATSLDYLKWYGRPYWSTLQHSDLLTIAEEKLLRLNQELNDNNYTQIFSARLALEFGKVKAMTRLTIESVRSHMRIMTGVEKSQIITTCAPSEPVLAAAAASLLLKDKSKYQAAVDALVNSLIPRGFVVDKGHWNELIARILLMLARDSAVLKQSNASPTVSHTPLISLLEFLKALLGKDIGISYLADAQQKVMRDDLAEWARPHLLNFTHFIQLKETFHALSADFLMECWCRGVALVCSSGQPVFDILLITYKGRLSDPFDKSLFGLVSIQVGLRETPAPSRLVDLLTCPIVLVEGGDEHRKPDHLVIFMDLGTTVKFESRFSIYCHLSHEKAKQPGTKSDPEVKNNTQSWQGYVGENEPSRYCINIRHHTFMQYEVISDLGPALNILWEEPSDFPEVVERMEYALNPFRGKLLTTTESWLK